MRQRFREIPYGVGVPRLVAIRDVRGSGLFSVKQRRLVPDLVRFIGALVRFVVVLIAESAVAIQPPGERIDSPDAERRACRDCDESTGLSEKSPAICE
jgi:hypothetical protein